jgi:hypothetical protein
MAIAMLPAGQRGEATAALLACRVLDAFEDLSPDPAAGIHAAARYLTGGSPVLPAAHGLSASRPSEHLDRALAHRIDLVRELVAALDADRRRRVERLVADVAAAMVAHVGRRERRAYGGDVLGRAVAYAGEVLTDGTDDGDRSAHRAVGRLLQLANDLRDDTREPYGADSAGELRYVVLLSSLTGSLAALDLVRSLHRRAASRGGRVAVAAMMLHTAAYFCRAAGVPPPVPRRARLLHALLAARGENAFERLCRRVEVAADACLNRTVSADLVLFAAPRGTSGTGSVALAVDAASHLIAGLPSAPLEGALPTADVRALMLADHVVLDAVEPTDDGDASDLRELADLLQRAVCGGTP